MVINRLGGRDKHILINFVDKIFQETVQVVGKPSTAVKVLNTRIYGYIQPILLSNHQITAS